MGNRLDIEVRETLLGLINFFMTFEFPTYRRSNEFISTPLLDLSIFQGLLKGLYIWEARSRSFK